jgi:pyruvate formate lyase activating enzyme
VAVAVTAPVAEGFVHSWDLSVGVDGPGTRFVVFLAGCPLRCLYCCSPDTWVKTNGTRRIADEVVGEAGRYARFISMAGGGFTVSGGEPLVQPRFTADLLHGARALGLHTAFETAGTLGAHAPDDLLDATDLVLLDLKSWEPATHWRVTGGADVRPALDFAKRVAEGGTPIWLRFVVVPGLTDAPENVEGLALFAAGLPTLERVEVLPFHRLGVAKYAALGRPFPLAATSPPSEAELARVRAQFADHGLVVA